MTVYVFGNPELAQDSLPLRILPELKRRRPDVEFVVRDPNEEWDVPAELLVIDTVVGIKTPRVFRSLDEFEAAPRLTTHDFDALANLKWLKKLGRLQRVRVLGLPPDQDEKGALRFILKTLTE